MKERFRYPEIMDKMNEVAKIIEARGCDGAPADLPGDRKKYRKLADMYKYYSLNKEKFSSEEQKKIDNGVIRKAQGWIPFTLKYHCDSSKYSEKLFEALGKK